MNFWVFLIVGGGLFLSGCGRGRPSTSAPSPQAEAQATYSRTRWYFTRQLAFSKLVPEVGAPLDHDSDTQATFQLASGSVLLYTEFLPSSGLKAFRGLGRLEPIPELASSVYLLKRTFSTGDNPEGVVLVGFWGDRMFRIEAQGTNQPTVLRDAISLATKALASLRNQAFNR
jgi:hypothetical protein